MRYLDFEKLESIDPASYQGQHPYPWVNPEGLLTPEGFDALRKEMPEVSQFEKKFGVQRKSGQDPHDRYTLEYTSDTKLSVPWQGFMQELTSDRYREALCHVIGVRSLDLNFHWHYTPNGCSVSPHADSKRKVGSHIFYFNTEDDWDESWGGETVVLDDNGRFPTRSAPAWEDFDSATASKAIGNYSFLFSRKGNSWHGVREIRCPEDTMRKVFIVVLNSNTLQDRVRRLFASKSFERY